MNSKARVIGKRKMYKVKWAAIMELENAPELGGEDAWHLDRLLTSSVTSQPSTLRSLCETLQCCCEIKVVRESHLA